MNLHRVKEAFISSRLIIFGCGGALFLALFASALTTYFALLLSPSLIPFVRQSAGRAGQSLFGQSPNAYTFELFRFILSNNTGHFWNPLRMYVWIPVVGTVPLGFEFLANSTVIGIVSALGGIILGPRVIVLGLVPHGIFEIPAFILEFAALTRWHAAIALFLLNKLSGKVANYQPLRSGIVDAAILSVVSIALFLVAAYIESFITPALLGVGR